MDMLIWTAKLNRKKILLTLLIAGVCIAAAVCFSLRGNAGSDGVNPKGVRDESDRVDYLGQWGWQVSPEATGVEELQLPDPFGPEYEQYLTLQSDQGFDLPKYSGKRIRRYTYDVLNYPTGEGGVVAHLLVYKNTVIGGEVMGSNFLHGLAVPT